jgi:hypothetical protein
MLGSFGLTASTAERVPAAPQPKTDEEKRIAALLDEIE